MSNFSPFPQYFQYNYNFKSQITFICEIWLFYFNYFFSQFCKSDILRYGYLEVFQRVPWVSRKRESTVFKIQCFESSLNVFLIPYILFPKHNQVPGERNAPLVRIFVASGFYGIDWPSESQTMVFTYTIRTLFSSCVQIINMDYWVFWKDNTNVQDKRNLHSSYLLFY